MHDYSEKLPPSTSLPSAMQSYETMEKDAPLAASYLSRHGAGDLSEMVFGGSRG